MTDLIELDAVRVALVQRLRQITDEQKQLAEEAEMLKRLLRAAVPVGSVATWLGKPVLAVQPNHQLSEAMAAAVLSPADFARCSKPTFSTRLAEEYLPREQYDLCCENRFDAATARQVLAPEVLKACMENKGAAKVILKDET